MQAPALVRDLMHIGVATCREDTPLPEAARTLLRDDLEAFVVLDEHGNAVGCLGRADLVAAYASVEWQSRSWESVTAGQVMRPDIPEVPPDIPATVAAQLMLDRGERQLYLMHHSCGSCWPAAIFRFEDLLRNVAGEPAERSL